MSDFQTEKESYEDFLRQHGIMPMHNYFIAFKYSAQFARFLPRGKITDPLIEKLYLLAFTPEEVLLKRTGSAASFSSKPDLSEKHLQKLKLSEIENFQVEGEYYFDDPGGYEIMFSHQSKSYYFYHPENKTDTYFTTNFHMLWDQDFFGLSKQK